MVCVGRVFLFGVALSIFLATGSFASSNVETESPFWIVIDGGSTGSRLHIFEFIDDRVERRGSSRANFPLSAFGRTGEDLLKPLNATKVAEHLLPTFVFAAEKIPKQYHASTPVYYQATAGMRLLDDTEQEALYDALYQGLVESPDFMFSNLQRENIATLSGEAEGFYGAVAANYLQGTIDVDLNFIATDAAPIGALDMGGSSTQIVFLPSLSSGSSTPDNYWRSCVSDDLMTHEPILIEAALQDCHKAQSSNELPSRLNGPDFFATSYLSYGVEKFRERLWTLWVKEHVENIKPNECDLGVVENPCLFPGYSIEWMGHTLKGTGDAGKCIEQVKRLIPHPHQPDHDHKLGTHVGGVEHPQVQGKFLAMSLYFFTLDSLRVLSGHEALELSWPSPSIAELYDALPGLCSREWHTDLSINGKHEFTSDDVLPHRCLESVYLVTLLRDGFGFSMDSRDITFTFLVDGNEVEWGLGMVLSLHAAQHARHEMEQEDDSNSTHRRATIPKVGQYLWEFLTENFLS
ncbi:hypothetical protein FisN_5Lh008 [Fistulifera solaris]|uniref:Apyrase n=1 Tax=Fistulifera solaris TaxID=1519565 RepID=A0A1Z5JJ83_FISSO|nr:hypothetical protein FisN_5Lh008 [Fistulifera solaris]|eukprot:GAX14065.1 hypothetical protein FisN_5Lh008 [Fistulifera solaris]